MFRVDFPLLRLSRFSSRLAAVALALVLAASFGGISAVEAKSGSNSWHKSGSHSVKSRHSNSRRSVKRYRGNRGYKSSRHLFARHSLKDARSSGVRLGHRNYRTHKNHRRYYRGHRRLVILNLNGTRTISNYDRYYNDRYDQDMTINGVSIYEKCPANFNCGLRAYDDNTGPRVITLGKAKKPATSSKVKKAGPPKVIKLDKVN